MHHSLNVVIYLFIYLFIYFFIYLFTIKLVLAGILYPPISRPVPEVRKVAATGGCSRNVSFITW